MADALKNLIDEKFIGQIAVEVKKHSKSFNAIKFKKEVLGSDWSELELKQRIRRISQTLHKNLDGQFENQIKVIDKVGANFSGLKAIVFPDFVSEFGLDHFDRSLKALKTLTPYSTSEFAIRPFLLHDLKRTLSEMHRWSRDKNEHVRRLASEGARPRLPWSFKIPALIEDPSPLLPTLEQLKNDPSLYVRKSVANCLNDISKDHPQFVIKLARRWLGKSKNTDWILKHGLRTLLKKGDLNALALFGLKPLAEIELMSVLFSQKKFSIGQHLQFQIEIGQNYKKSQTLRLEYAVHYLKKNGSHSKKVFKLTERPFAPGQHKISRKHSLKQMTTRQHIPGVHHLEVIINGKVMACKKFDLTR